jgi:hypothetical protein
VNNNPIRYNDPSGHSPEGRCGGGGGCDKNAYEYVPPKKPSATPSITTPRADEDDEDDRPPAPYQPASQPNVQPVTPGKVCVDFWSPVCDTDISSDTFQSDPVYLK